MSDQESLDIGADNSVAVGLSEVAPRTIRGRRMKAEILAASRRVFARDGFARSRVLDIATEAGASSGSFYRYFTDKHDALYALLQQMLDDFYELARSPWDPSAPGRSVEVTTRRYLEIYRDRHDLMALLVEVAQTDERFRLLWTESRSRFFTHIERSLVNGQQAGVVRNDVEPSMYASLLGAMTEQMAYLTYVLKAEPDRELERIVDAIVSMWARAVFVVETS